jgi:hypothetical protein
MIIAVLFGETVLMTDYIAFLNCKKGTARLILDQDPITHYAKKLAVSKTVVHFRALVQSM